MEPEDDVLALRISYPICLHPTFTILDFRVSIFARQGRRRATNLLPIFPRKETLTVKKMAHVDLQRLTPSLKPFLLRVRRVRSFNRLS